MPMFDYQCKEHGVFEKMKKIAERETAPCPECGETCPQIISPPAMVNGGYMDSSLRFSKKN